MKPATAILLVGAAAIAAFVILRPKSAPATAQPSALASAFDFGKTLVARWGDSEEAGR